MCKYCEKKYNNVKLQSDKNGDFQICNEEIPTLEYLDENGILTMVGIDFCPMCGKKLNSENSIFI